MSIGRRIGRIERGAAVAGIWLGLLLPAERALAEFVCQADLAVPAILEPNAALERNPERLDPRMRLAAALMERGCYRDVVAVLEPGAQLHPQVDELKLLLRDARSLLEEERYFEGLEEAEAAAKLKRNLLRCRELDDVAACNAALREQPGDPALLIAKAEAQHATSGLAPALETYHEVLALFPDHAGASARLRALQSERETLLATCLDMAGEEALSACDGALIPGAADELEIHKRRGLLLQQAGRPAQALEAYIAADNLRRGDRTTATAIAALTQSTGRSDAIALAANGSAQLTLGRVNEAVRVLREAQALAPGFGTVAADLATAEARRRALATECTTAPAERAISACRAALLPQARDEFEIRLRLATLLLDSGDAVTARPHLESARRLRADDPALAIELARLATTSAAAAAGGAAATERRRPDGVETLARRYSNAEPHGQTH
jgi:tetratricopeptide (TPR) repeat protein